MSKSTFSIKIKILAIILCFCLVGIFFYLSVLGENDKAKGVVKNFFEEIKNTDYLDAEKSYAKTSKKRFVSFDDSMKFHFILELALLKHFGLIDKQDYNVKVERESFWLPMIGNDEIALGIKLLPKNKISFFSDEKREYLQQFITVSRENGTWKIKSVNTDKSVLQSPLNRIGSEIDLNKYVEIYDKGFILKSNKVNTNELSQLEKKVIIHSLNTAIEKLQNSQEE